MRTRVILLSFLILFCLASDINAGDADCLSYESCFEDAITLYKDGNLNEALENFRFLADNRLDITNPEIAGIPYSWQVISWKSLD